MQVVFHNLVWIVDKQEQDGSVEAHAPDGFRELDFNRQRALALEWTRQAAEFAEGRIDIVNVYNEPLNAWTDPYEWGMQRRRELLEDVVRTFRRHNSTSQIQVSIGEALTANYGNDAEWLLSWMRARDLPVDRVALQLWSNGVFRWDENMPYLNLAEIDRQLDRLAAHGYPLDLTEFQAPSEGSTRLFWRWTPERQADWSEAVVTLAFGKPGIASANYFRSHGSFMIDGDVYEGLQPLPVVQRLRELFESWKSEGEAVTDDRGQIQIRGFPGRYVVEPLEPGNSEALSVWYVQVPGGESSEAGVGSGELVEMGAEERHRGDDIAPLTASAVPAPSPAPASIARLGPQVTAEHYLDVKLEPVDAAAREKMQTEADATLLDQAMPLRWKTGRSIPLGMTWTDAGLELGDSFVGGFCFDSVPAGARSLDLLLHLPDDGHPVLLNIFDHARRYVDLDLAPGDYRVTIPLTDDSRPVVQLTVPMGTREDDGEGDDATPYGIVTAARFLDHDANPPKP